MAYVLRFLEPALRSGSTAVPGRGRNDFQRSRGGHGPARYVGIGSGSRACTRAAGKVAAGQSRLSHGAADLLSSFYLRWRWRAWRPDRCSCSLVAHTAAELGFWLTFVTLLDLITRHAVYWVVTHPVNKFWFTAGKSRRIWIRFFLIRREPVRALSGSRSMDGIARPLGVLTRRAGGLCVRKPDRASDCGFGRVLAALQIYR